jgi:DNA polymerase elongation subunit (family B)
MYSWTGPSAIEERYKKKEYKQNSLFYKQNKEAIIQAIIQHGFEVRYEKSYTFRPDEVELLYIKHRNDKFFRSVIDAYTT